MKYLAIFKDSLREALDSTVLYVMIGLSTLAIFFVASLSFTPLPAEKTMEKFVDGTMNLLLDFEKLGRKAPESLARLSQIGKLTLKKVEVISGTPDAPESDYRLFIAAQAPDKEKAALWRKDPQEGIDQVKQHFVNVAGAGLIKINDIALAGEQTESQDSNIVFVVNTQSTMGTRRVWLTDVSLLFGAIPLTTVVSHLLTEGHMNELELPIGLQLFVLTSTVVSIGSWIVVITGIIISSFFIPNMLRKGTVDLLLVKPIHRWALLTYKYIGGLTFIFVNNIYAVVGIWLALGLRSGIWANWFLLLILILTFFFAILYAISACIGVLTRSAVAAILVTIGAWFLFFLVGVGHQVFESRIRAEEKKELPAEKREATNSTFGKVIDAVHRVLPRTSDLNHLAEVIMVSDLVTGNWTEANKILPNRIEWSESALVSGIFIAVLLSISCWWFATKDY